MGACPLPGHRHHHDRPPDRETAPHRDLFHRADGRYYITGTPDRPRSWYANLLARPSFTFHLKQSATADLPATARPVIDPAEREEILPKILAPLSEVTSVPGMELSAWVARSPLVEVTFDS
jgi:hypothetical protein